MVVRLQWSRLAVLHAIQRLLKKCLHGADSATDSASLLTGESDTPAWDRTPDVAAAVANIRGAGDIFAGSGLLNQLHTRDVRP